MANEPAKPIILVVDDTEDIRDLIMSVLQDTYTLRPAFDGRSALKRALEKPAPDLILLDVDMPGSSGHDVCRALKVTAATAEIPVIFLTGRDEPADDGRCSAGGVRHRDRERDRKSTRLNSSHMSESRMPSSA